MNISSVIATICRRSLMVAVGFGLVMACAAAQQNAETDKRVRIAAANMEDAIVVDCQLPGKLRKLGGTRTYLTPGRLIRTSAVVCRTRGGEYTLGDLASGTLSLKRWRIPADGGDAEAQYYVARIYATGMDNVPVDYTEAARWYQMAADRGYREAKQELGYLYEQGLGVEQNSLKALNLQRDASGLGEDLDFAYKIADAELIAANLTKQLRQANGVLRDSQLTLNDTRAALTAAKAEARGKELEIVNLVADLQEARAAAGSGSSEKVAQMEQALERTSSLLQQNESTILELEQERDAAKSALSRQLSGGQATQLELRELLARTEQSEQRAESLAGQLAEAQQRLIQSDQEIQELQAAYRIRSDQLASDAERLLAARTRSDSDGAAYLAAKEAEIAAKAARISSLEGQVQTMRARLAAAESSEAEDALNREIEMLEARYAADVRTLREERATLEKNAVAGSEQLNTLYAQAKEHIAQMGDELTSRRREIDTLSTESETLRTRVQRMEAAQMAQAEQSGLTAERSQAQLSAARQEAISLRSSLDAIRIEKTTLEAKLANDRIRLQEQQAQTDAASVRERELLRADIEAAQSTIRAQDLRIAALVDKATERDAQIAVLKSEVGTIEPPVVQVSDAMTVLNMARSPEEPNLGVFHALLIANEQYNNLEPLTTPIRDARKIERLLIDRYGFNVNVLTNATGNDIMRALHDYGNTLTSKDNLLIYYAGRGSTPDGPPDKAYWLGVDADPDFANTWVLADHISGKINQMGAKRILLVTDSCFSKRGVQGRVTAAGRGINPRLFKLMTKQNARLVLTSGENLPVYDETGDRTHSLFAKYFMEILRQNNNVLSGEMLSYEMVSRIRERIADPDRATPSFSELQNSGHVAGDFYFVPIEELILLARN